MWKISARGELGGAHPLERASALYRVLRFSSQARPESGAGPAFGSPSPRSRANYVHVRARTKILQGGSPRRRLVE